MDSVARDNLSELLEAPDPPCLSLYQPTSRHHPENQQDPIRFRNLVRTIERSLRESYPIEEVEPLLEPLRALADDRGFWNTTHDGLATFGAKGFFRVFRLQRPVDEFAVVADSFHIKPLLRVLQSADRYQILGLDSQSVRLFEGNRDAVAEVELAPGVPRTITEALGEVLTEPHQTVASYKAGPGGAPSRHGHGAKKDETDVDAERFFRAIDRAVLDHHSRPAQLPLLLAALPEHHPLFHRVSSNPFLMQEGLEIDPDALELDELRERAWQVVEPRYQARLAELVEAFGTAMSNDLGAQDPADVARAAVAGRVATLLIDADRQIPGRIDVASGAVATGELSSASVDDILDDLSEIVLRAGGDLVVVPSERMPTPTGIAAIYRY